MNNILITIDELEQKSEEYLRVRARNEYVLGGFLVAIALILFLLPILGTMMTSYFLAWMLLFVGIVKFFSSFSEMKFALKCFGMIIGIAIFLSGIFLLNHQSVFVVFSTYYILMMVILSAIYGIIFTFRIANTGKFTVSLILNVFLLFMSFSLIGFVPAIAQEFLGIFIAIQLLLSGVNKIQMAGLLSRVRKETT